MGREVMLVSFWLRQQFALENKLLLDLCAAKCNKWELPVNNTPLPSSASTGALLPAAGYFREGEFGNCLANDS